MVSSDSDLIARARVLTDYPESVVSSSDFQRLVDIGKDELRTEFGDDSFTFYREDTGSADSALFWFTCIAAKIKAGEIGGVDIEVESISTTDSQSEYNVWFENFRTRLQEAQAESGVTRVAQRELSRDGRSYGDE